MFTQENMIGKMELRQSGIKVSKQEGGLFDRTYEAKTFAQVGDLKREVSTLQGILLSSCVSNIDTLAGKYGYRQEWSKQKEGAGGWYVSMSKSKYVSISKSRFVSISKGMFKKKNSQGVMYMERGVEMSRKLGT